VTDQLRYSMVIQWSEDDQAYLVTLPEWEGRVLNPVTHGQTYLEAIRRGEEALAALVTSAQQHHEPLPEPRVIARTA
jgi:antitoxin HicB